MLDNMKKFRSLNYNFNFNKETGFFMRWGKDLRDDPSFCIFGPEILDIELTTICDGIGNYGPCSFCYKSNTLKGDYMSFETYKEMFELLRGIPVLTQIAFGVDSKCKSNPDIFRIMEYTRENGIIPNVTVADISDEVADKLVSVCGAVAVSRYFDKDICYDSVKRLSDRGLKQTNIHILVSNETEEMIYETFNDYLSDDRLSGLNAIVLLSLKQKGRGKSYSCLGLDRFGKLIDYAFSKRIPIGMDSCSANKVLSVISDYDNRKEIETFIEPCESGCFSFYSDVYGNFYPCSFIEGVSGWDNGLSYKDFGSFAEIWNDERVLLFRDNLLRNNRSCPIFEV